MEHLEIDFAKLGKAVIENLPQEDIKLHWVFRAVYYFQAFCLMIIAIFGFVIYLFYLNRSANNTSRMLNNLYGFFALDGINISIHKFTHLVLIDYFSEEIPIMCLLDVFRVHLVSVTNLIISMISTAILLRQIFPEKYLDLSKMWSNKIFGILIMALSSLHLIWSVKTCGLCEPDCIVKQLVFILFISLPWSILVVIYVTIDSVWGFVELFNRVRSLFSCNSPVMQFNPANEALTVNFKVDINN